MNADDLRPFAEPLHKLLKEAFDRAELNRLMRFRLEERLEWIVEEDDFNTIVFEVVTWADRNGRMLELAEKAATEKLNRPEFRELVAKMREVADAAAPAANQRPRAEEQPRIPIMIERASQDWGDLTALARSYERLLRVVPDGSGRTKACNGLVEQMQLLLDEPNDIAESLHLSSLIGDRLAAIVALRMRPDIRFLNWLAERLAVEDAFVGYFAAVALHDAAKTVSNADLDAVIEAVERALAHSKPLQENTGRKRVLKETLVVIQLRSTNRPLDVAHADSL